MKRNFTLFVLVLSVLINASSSFATVYTFNAGNPIVNYYLNSGDSLSIASGTYTGQVNSNSSTAKITIAQNASFKPSSFGFLGQLRNNGSATLPTINGYQSGLTIINYGVLTITSTTYITGGLLTNEFGGTVTFTGTATFQNNNARLTNKGSVIAKADIYFGSGILTNSGSVVADGEIKLDNNTTITNGGKIHSKSVFTIQNSAYTNFCRTIAEGGFKLFGSTVFTNNGLMWASNAKSDSYLQNQATIDCKENSRIKSVNLMNFGTIKGSGHLYFTGVTSTQGTVGHNGSTTDQLVVYDVTRTGSQIFDNQAGQIRNNVIYASFAAPDTINNYPYCSSEMIAIALPVKWNYFLVNLADNTPSITWGTEQDPGTTYEVERSYDGNNFFPIYSASANTASIDFQYSDIRVNTQAPVVYYRIRATEPNGKTEFSTTRSVKFSNKTGVTIQTVPNPFTSHVTINYQSTTSGKINIAVYSLNGQLQFSKTINVRNGYNSIAVSETAPLAKGMYLVQVSRENQLIATQKIVKQ